MMCTIYNRPFSSDQRPLWDDFRTNFGSKFSMSWISARLDFTEYNDLLGHAKNKNLQGIWLFQADEASDFDSRISSFSEEAWKQGWLKKMERRWKYVYTCVKPNPCDCDPDDLSDGWLFEEKIPTYELREITY